MKQSYKHKIFCIVLLMSMLILSISGCSKNAKTPDSNQSHGPSYPIDSSVQTTLQKTIE